MTENVKDQLNSLISRKLSDQKREDINMKCQTADVLDVATGETSENDVSNQHNGEIVDSQQNSSEAQSDHIGGGRELSAESMSRVLHDILNKKKLELWKHPEVRNAFSVKQEKP